MRLHAQRLMMIIAAGIAAVGVFVPWLVSTNGSSINGLTRPSFGGSMLGALTIVIALCLVGKRDERLQGPVFGTAVLLALAVGGFGGLVYLALLDRGQIGAPDGGLMQFSAGLFMVIGGALLVVLFAFAVGRRAKPSVGSVMSGWNRRD